MTSLSNRPCPVNRLSTPAPGTCKNVARRQPGGLAWALSAREQAVRTTDRGSCDSSSTIGYAGLTEEEAIGRFSDEIDRINDEAEKVTRLDSRSGRDGARTTTIQLRTERSRPSIGGMGARADATELSHAVAALLAALDAAPPDGVSADELAARVGRSRAWVFATARGRGVVRRADAAHAAPPRR